MLSSVEIKSAKERDSYGGESAVEQCEGVHFRKML